MSNESKEAQMISRRKTPRRKFSRVVGLIFAGQRSLSRAMEIGEGGIMIQAVGQVQVRDEVVVTFSIPGQKLITSRGTVRYVAELSVGNAFGVQFTDLDISDRRLIRSYVAAKSEEEAAIDTEQRAQPKTYAFSVDEKGNPKPTAL